MSTMTVELTPDLEERVEIWRERANGDTGSMMTEALDRYLEDWEDYTDAVQICSEVDARRMETYSWEEVKEHLGLEY